MHALGHLMRSLTVVVILMSTIVFSSCKDKRPSGIMSEGKMEDVLYEYHLVQAIASSSGDSVNFRKHTYTDAVLKKYNISQAEFDSSLVWYSQHTESLYAIYQNIDKRLQKESDKLGLQTNSLSNYAQLSNKGDTANVWNLRSFFCLTSSPAFRLVTFHIKVDTSYHSEDSFLWQFHSHFISQSGARDAVANLSIRYMNDSVGSVTQHFGLDQDCSISLPPSKRKIKSIYGFIYHNAVATSGPKLLIITNPSLIRYHKTKKSPVVVVDSTHVSDSIASRRMDSIKNTKTLNIHFAPIPRMKNF